MSRSRCPQVCFDERHCPALGPQVGGCHVPGLKDWPDPDGSEELKQCSNKVNNME